MKNCINHIDYLIRYYEETINYYSKDKHNIYDIIKLKEAVDYLYEIKNYCFENQQSNTKFKIYYYNSKKNYKKDYIDLIFLFDKEMDWVSLDTKIFSEKELFKFKKIEKKILLKKK